MNNNYINEENYSFEKNDSFYNTDDNLEHLFELKIFLKAEYILEVIKEIKDLQGVKINIKRINEVEQKFKRKEITFFEFFRESAMSNIKFQEKEELLVNEEELKKLLDEKEDSSTSIKEEVSKLTYKETKNFIKILNKEKSKIIFR
jgi:hypothetical protein